MVSSNCLFLIILCLRGMDLTVTVQRGNDVLTSSVPVRGAVGAGADGKGMGSDEELPRNEVVRPELPDAQENAEDSHSDWELPVNELAPKTEEKHGKEEGINGGADSPSPVNENRNNDPGGQGKDVVQHDSYTKDSTSQRDSDDGGRDDSSTILLYSVPVTAVALVVVCTALIIKCRSWQADRRKKFGPGTEMSLMGIFSKNRMKGFHRISTDSDNEEQSDNGSVF